ncbi:MAG: hypothetical protein E7Z97_11875 [Propionibacteriaceae bacterium]|uniref:Uncharacterized protein n=1 Tax=Propionibacterium ruminifibrarum TaxID=1962131 RepID=A0A375HZQ2_9ACTN|nr:hypothetical protein [Propionibacterium ruminifibrarum]MBE6478741.1 hypothetical protein [Propionibacteriaceae bacterium]SPF67972.1 Hypothetical protein PROPJV5_0929 [Propionibacterium ruminifibrarum]
MSESTQTRRHTAGLFDIRNVIGILLGLYGIILTLMGLFADKALDKTGGVNANLIGGIALIVVGLVFLAWAGLRPTYVPEPADEAAGQQAA